MDEEVCTFLWGLIRASLYSSFQVALESFHDIRIFGCHVMLRPPKPDMSGLMFGV